MLLRFRPDVIDLKPKVVVILAGTNDISGNTGQMTLEAIEGNLASMVELAHANGINVVIASVLPVSDYNTNKAGEKIIRAPNGTEKSIRGGSFLCADNFCSNYRVAGRSRSAPDSGLNNLGFRCAQDVK